MWIKLKDGILVNTKNLLYIRKLDTEKSCLLMLDSHTISYANAMCRDADYKRLCKKLKVKEL